MINDFRIGEKAVYPAHGVAEVIGIEKKEINTSVCSFYVLKVLALAAGRAVLQQLRTNNLVAAAESSRPGSAGSQLKTALEGLRDLDVVGDVRGIGLLWAVEFVADKKNKRPFTPEMNIAPRVGSAAVQRGLLVYPMQGCVDGISGDHLLLAPPAIITSEQIVWSVDQLRAAILEVASSTRHH